MKKCTKIAVLLIILVILLFIQYLRFDNNYLSYLMILPGLVIGFILAVLIHELGHLFFGLLSGYKFTSFKFLFIKIFKKDKLKIVFEKFYLAMPGQCLMKPTNKKYFLYNLGGLIFTYILSVFLLLLFLFGENMYLIQLFYGAFVINTFLGVINSIYTKQGINDMSNIIRCRNNPDFLEGVLYQLDIIASITIDKKFKSKYNPKDYVGGLYSDISIWRIKYYKAYFEKNSNDMNHYYNLIKRNYKKVQIAVIRLMCLTLLLNHELIIEQNISLIDRRLKNTSKTDMHIYKKFKGEYKLLQFYQAVVNKENFDINELDYLTSNRKDDLLDKINDDTIYKLKRIYNFYEKNNFELKIVK